MKSSHKVLSILAVATVLTPAATAQQARSGYFLEDYTYRFEQNPAMDNTRNYISMPVLANINTSLQGSIGVSDILYNVNGKTTTFLNPDVSADKVLKSIGSHNRLNADLKLDILSAGFKAFGGYNTITLSARTDINAQLPVEIFSLLKEGIANRSYNISDLGVRGIAYGQIALGHSHRINDKFRVGATLKLLAGLGYFDAKLDKAELSLGTDNWTITTDAQIDAALKGLKYKTKTNTHTGHEYVNGGKIDGFGLNGFGAAFDLGVIYTPARDWQVSAAVLDLGFINWSQNNMASTQGEKTFQTDRYTFNANDKADNSFSKELDNIRDDISALYELDDLGDIGSKSRMLAATTNVGVQYTLPVYRKLTFGLLNTTRINGDYTWTDFRLSANIAPVKCFDASVNMHAGTFGVGLGWLLNLHVTGFNLFVGMDHTPTKFAKQGVPLQSNASLNAGMNFLF